MAYARPFLKVIDDYISLSPTENKAYRTKHIPWDEWGSKSTFWFDHSTNILSKSTMYGYRVMTPTALYDFTPQGNGRAVSDTERSQVVNGTDVCAWGLDVNPNTSMPFRVSELKGPDVQFGTYILGDELLAVKRTTGEKVFTLFAPQIDGSIGSRC
ncbi:hypothetical protein IEO21_04460 [Rhodonia placenta]|uniref:Uncharacterized protein n=1 Tax=Rhodonia placenta TaxID=104341 RepID=A0A8H7P3Y5_9APHY|nr:hypothetical protein IEO21_04460 [Postia placenta]